MFDSRKELLDKIRLGEDTFLEYKEVRFSGGRVTEPRRDSLADELAAFANSRGGVFVMGVEDGTREIQGIPNERLDTAERFVHELCHDSIDPPIAPVIERLELPTTTGEDAVVIRIDVPRSLFVHRSPGGYMLRVGSARRIMSSEYLARLFQQRSQTRIIRFDGQTVSNATLDDLQPELWERFRTPRSPSERERFLSKLHMARADDEGTPRPTVAGLLTGAADARPWLPNAYVQAVAYRGTSIRVGASNDPYQLDAADIHGPLDTQIVDACRFVAKNMKTAAFKDQGRLDRPQFDMSAVFEAVVNAVAHRDYSIHGSKIRLRLFENRLELYSPGAIPNSMDVEDLGDLQSARNDVIASLLAKIPVPDQSWLTTDRSTMMDRRGEGVRVILDNSERLSGRTPEYRLIGDAELLLTIHAPADPKESSNEDHRT